MEPCLNVGSKEYDISYYLHRFWPNSLHAHRLIYYAQSIHFNNVHGLILRLFEATYEEGKNISKIETLLDIANEVGLEGAQAVLQSNEFEEEVLEEDTYAKFDLEIR